MKPTSHRDPRSAFAIVIWSFLFAFGATALASAAEPRTGAGTASAIARSSTWIAVDVPFTGDDNNNGYTVFEIGPAPDGPFSPVSPWPALGGRAEWRATVVFVSPGSTSYLRVTFSDPDGVVGAAVQVLGPITTAASGSDAVTVGSSVAVAGDEEIFVSTPISDDANRNSQSQVDVALTPAGPWTAVCHASQPGVQLLNPKRCRVRSLVPGTDYWLRISIADPDGVVGGGPNPQVIGPVHFAGRANLALRRPVSADAGWGCCPDPGQLVDGVVQAPDWFYGYAWTGGTNCWAGGCPTGFKQATIDLGAPVEFNRVVVFHHDPSEVPLAWKIEYSDDGIAWNEAYSTSEPSCRTPNAGLPGYWGHPGCAHEADFPPIVARYARYAFDDGTLVGGMHGWASEIEVFRAKTNAAPVAEAGVDRIVAATTPRGAEVVLDGSGSSDPDGDPLTYTWTGPFPEGNGTVTGAHPTVTLPLGRSVVTLTVSDGSLTSLPDSAPITVTLTVAGLLPPLAALADDGASPPAPARPFNRGRVLPLRLQMLCGATPLAGADIAAPSIVSLARDGGQEATAALDLDAGNANDGTRAFRYEDGYWIYNLSTRQLSAGAYVIAIETPDGVRHAARFDLR